MKFKFTLNFFPLANLAMIDVFLSDYKRKE